MIVGSVVNYFPTAGENTITLPKPGLTIVGVIVGSQFLAIQITPGKKAYFPGGGGTFFFQPVNYNSPDAVLNVTTTGNDVTVITYYGTPEAKSPALTSYAGVYYSIGVAVPASLSTPTLETATLTVTFPAGATQITGFEYSSDVPSGVTANGVAYLGFATSTGQTVNLGINPRGESYLPDYPNMTGILPLAIPIATSFTVTLGAYFTNSNASSATYQPGVVLYYR